MIFSRQNKSNHQGMQCVLSSLLTESITKLIAQFMGPYSMKTKGYQSDKLINQSLQVEDD